MDDRALPTASNDPPSEVACLRQQVETLREAVRARDDFIAIAAHELRNPMTPIMGLTELALAVARKTDGTDHPRITALLERLQQAVQDYVGRATRLLDVSRIEAGNIKLQPEWLDVRRGLHRERIDENGFTIGGATDETGMRGFWSHYASLIEAP